MTEDIEEEVIFKGSALYAHLAALQLTEEEEEDEHHPLLPSLKTVADGCSPVTAGYSDAQQAPQWKYSLYQRLYCWSWRKIESLLDRLFQTNKREKRLLWRLASLLCTRGLLTQDDRLHLYYFSPVFSQLMEEPSLAAADSLGGSSITSTPSAIVGRGLVGGVALAVTIVVAAAAVVWGGVTLSETSVLCCPWLWSAALYSLLLPGLVTATAISCRSWHARRYDRCCSGLEHVLGSLASLQLSCLPHAFAAAADAGLLTGPNNSESASTPLIRRVRKELLQLQQLLHSTLQCALQLVERAGSVCRPEGEDLEHTWPTTKAARRQLELLVSAYARDILLQAERAYGKESARLSGSPFAPSSAFSPRNVSSVLAVVTEAYVPLTEQLPQLESYSSLMKSQVMLLRHCWLYSGEETRPRKIQTEEQAAADILTRHLQTGLRQVEQARVVLQTLSDSSVQAESTRPEQVPINGTASASKPTNSRHYDVDEDSVTAFEETYHAVCSQLKELRVTVDLCLNDVNVLEESVTWSRLRLLQQLGRAEAGTRGPTSGVVFSVDDKGTLLKPTESGDLVELVPYIAEDEVFEASTEPAEDGGREGKATGSSSEWLADAEEDQQKKRLRACGRRLLAELQPILATKKKEFQEREKRAWKRMKGAGEEDEVRSEDEVNQPNSAASIPEASHNEGLVSNSGSSSSSLDEDNNHSLGVTESIPSVVNNEEDTASTLTNTSRCISKRSAINAATCDLSCNEHNISQSVDKSINIKLGLKTNGVLHRHSSRVEAVGKELHNSAKFELPDINFKSAANAYSSYNDQTAANNHEWKLEKFCYFLLPVVSAPESTAPAVVDVYGVGRASSPDRLLLLPLLRVPLTGLPRLKESKLSLHSNQRKSKLVQLESCGETKGIENDLSGNSVDFTAASVAVDAPPVMDCDDHHIFKFVSDNHSRLLSISDEDGADHETELMRRSFLYACDSSCSKSVQFLTRTWTILRQVSIEKDRESFRGSRLNDICEDQFNVLRLNQNKHINSLGLSLEPCLNVSSPEGKENELSKAIIPSGSCSRGSVTAVHPKTLTDYRKYTSYSDDSCDDDVTATTALSTLGENQRTTSPEAQVFTSDPSTDAGDNIHRGESSWNIEEKPIDLQGRLKMLLHSHMQERGVEEMGGEGGEGRDGASAVSLGFHSQLALQAVQMSSQFGISGGREEMFGGLGQNEVVFGDPSTDEEGSESDCSGEGEGWAQTEM